MIRINEKEYSGSVSQNGKEELCVILATSELFRDVAQMITTVKEVTDISNTGIETVYSVSAPISASIVSQNLYALKFSTKPTVTQELEAKNQELSNAIDDILVLILEE